jgi:hypothetical protein
MGMGLQTETSTNKIVSADDVAGGSTDGYLLGQTATSYLGFYGTAPVQQPTGYTALTDSSGGTAAAGTGIQALSSSYNSALIVNGITTCAAAINLILSNLRAVGIIK